MHVEYMDIADAVGVTIPYGASKLPGGYGDCVRFVSDPSVSEAMILTYDPLVSVCRRFPMTGGDQIDVCVSGRKLEASVQSLDRGEPVEILLHDDGLLELRQGEVSACLDTLSSADFPGNLEMNGVVPIFSGLNPTAGLEALKHVASSNIGTVQLHDVLIFMDGATYLLGSNSVVRGNFSLMDKSAPPERAVMPIQVKSILPLAGLGAEVAAYADGTKLVVADARGHIIVRQSAVDVKNIPNQITAMYGSLVLLGQIRVERTLLVEILKSAIAILTGDDLKKPYLTMEGNTDELLISGKSGRVTFARRLEAECSKNYKIYVNADRLLAFARASADDEILIRVMDSPINKQAMNFVHLVDSRLHEIVSIPLTNPIEEVK